MRYIAIDLGDRRTGLALGDSDTGIATPLTTVHVDVQASQGRALLEALARAITQELGPDPKRHPGELVLGLPLNMDGTEGPRSRVVRSFARLLEERTQRTIRFQDERLTTAEADWQMARSGLTHGQKKSRRDAVSAANILRDYLSGLSQPSGIETEPES